MKRCFVLHPHTVAMAGVLARPFELRIRVGVAPLTAGVGLARDAWNTFTHSRHTAMSPATGSLRFADGAAEENGLGDRTRDQMALDIAAGDDAAAVRDPAPT